MAEVEPITPAGKPPVISSTLLDTVAIKEPAITVNVISAIFVEKYFIPKKEEVKAAAPEAEATGSAVSAEGRIKISPRARHLAEEEKKREEERRREEQRRREEEERRKREEEEAKARVAIVTKQAKLLFRYSVDLNVIKRIKEVVEAVLVDNKKEKLNIHIKAYPNDANSIALEIKLPQNEMDLLVSMMKALGGASLGITKIILE